VLCGWDDCVKLVAVCFSWGYAAGASRIFWGWIPHLWCYLGASQFRWLLWWDDPCSRFFVDRISVSYSQMMWSWLKLFGNRWFFSLDQPDMSFMFFDAELDGPSTVRCTPCHIHKGSYICLVFLILVHAFLVACSWIFSCVVWRRCWYYIWLTFGWVYPGDINLKLFQDVIS